MKILNKILIFLIIPFSLYADVMLSDATYNQLVTRLKKDKQIIGEEQLRWNKLKKTTPVIKYKVEDKTVVVQTIEIPVYNAKPIIYEMKFEINTPTTSAKILPLQLFLAGTVELTGVDAKAGVQVFNVEKFISQPVGINLLVGAKSFGGSLSYTLPKMFDNTMAHVYIGKTYSLDSTAGVGISLNF